MIDDVGCRAVGNDFRYYCFVFYCLTLLLDLLLGGLVNVSLVGVET